MQVTLTQTEYRALNALRGLPQGAHMLVMCSLPTATGATLEGSDDDFSEILSFIGEQMADGMLSETAERALRSMCLKIDPDCADWLGM